jgi:hypothetical protein
MYYNTELSKPKKIRGNPPLNMLSILFSKKKPSTKIAFNVGIGLKFIRFVHLSEF